MFDLFECHAPITPNFPSTSGCEIVGDVMTAGCQVVHTNNPGLVNILDYVGCRDAQHKEEVTNKKLLNV